MVFWWPRATFWKFREATLVGASLRSPKCVTRGHQKHLKDFLPKLVLCDP